jgi:hypothetical protein
MYTIQHKVEQDKLRNHDEMYLNTGIQFEVLPNLKETTTPSEEMKGKTHETSKNKHKQKDTKKQQ